MGAPIGNKNAAGHHSGQNPGQGKQQKNSPESNPISPQMQEMLYKARLSNALADKKAAEDLAARKAHVEEVYAKAIAKRKKKYGI